MKFERIISVGDIHGEFELLQKLVEDVIRFTPDDQLVFLGDAIDRGESSKQVVLYIQRLKRKYPENIILLLGNHEQMAYEYFTLRKNSNLNEWLNAKAWVNNNGGKECIESFGGEHNAKSVLLPFIESLLPFYETETHIFVHGGISSGGGKPMKDISLDELLWCRDYKYNGSKTLIVGHTPKPEVTRLGNIVIVDTGACYTGRLSAFNVMEERVYQCVKKTKNRVLSFTAGM
jgi:serine/threonine protein phosphatase 1